MSVFMIASFFVLLTTEAGRKDAGTLASTVAWAGAAFYLARRVRPTT
jgi:hypothetical protein